MEASDMGDDAEKATMLLSRQTLEGLRITGMYNHNDDILHVNIKIFHSQFIC